MPRAGNSLPASPVLASLLSRFTLRNLGFGRAALLFVVIYCAVRRAWHHYLAEEAGHPRTRMTTTLTTSGTASRLCSRPSSDLATFIFSHRIAAIPETAEDAPLARETAEDAPLARGTKRESLLQLIGSGVHRFDIDISPHLDELIVAHPSELQGAPPTADTPHIVQAPGSTRPPPNSNPATASHSLTLKDFLEIMAQRAPNGVVTIEAKFNIDPSLLLFRRMVDVIMASPFLGETYIVASNSAILSEFMRMASASESLVDRIGVAVAYRSQPLSPGVAAASVAGTSEDLFRWGDRRDIEHRIWRESGAYGVAILHMPDVKVLWPSTESQKVRNTSKHLTLTYTRRHNE